MLVNFFRNNRDLLQRYAFSGSLVFIFGHLQYRIFYTALKGACIRAGAAWGIHFIIATIWSHGLHRFFTFRHQSQVPYLESLFRTIGSNIFLLALSTLLMFLLCDVEGLSPLTGWIIGTALCAMCNFFIMIRWTICRGPKDHNELEENYFGDDKRKTPLSNALKP